MTASSGMSGDLMRRFCETKGYAELATMDSAGAYMHVNGPMGLAAFVAYCSGNRRIYLRGSTIDHPYSVPTLFRRDGDGRQYDYPECKRRWYAYRDLLIRLRSILSDRRWHRPRLGAVLQHYGLKTPWFDVVRTSTRRYGSLRAMRRAGPRTRLSGGSPFTLTDGRSYGSSTFGACTRQSTSGHTCSRVYRSRCSPIPTPVRPPATHSIHAGSRISMSIGLHRSAFEISGVGPRRPHVLVAIPLPVSGAR